MKSFIVLLIAFNIVGCNKLVHIDPEFLVISQNNGVIVTSKENSIIINGVNINRGNCTYQIIPVPLSLEPKDAKLPKTLKFGESFMVYPDCILAEISLDTSMGIVSYGF